MLVHEKKLHQLPNIGSGGFFIFNPYNDHPDEVLALIFNLEFYFIELAVKDFIHFCCDRLFLF